MEWLKNVSKFKINELFEKFNMIRYIKLDEDVAFEICLLDNKIEIYNLYCYEEFNEQTGEITYCVYGREKV